MIQHALRVSLILWLLTSSIIVGARWWGAANPNPRIAYPTLSDDLRDIVRIVDIDTQLTRDIPTLYRGTTRFGAVQWSDDGRYLYYGDELRYGRTLDIFVYDIQTDSSRALTNAPGNERYPRLSPDNQWMVYLTDDETPPAVLRLMNLTDQSERIIAPRFVTNDLQVVWSSDSQRFAYILAETAYIYDIDTQDTIVTLKDPAGINRIQWQRDNISLIYSTMRADDALYRVSIADPRPVPIAPLEQMMASETTDFLIAPDDTRIAWSKVTFASGEAVQTGVAKWLMLWDGESHRELTIPDAFFAHQPVRWLDDNTLVYRQAYWDSRRGTLHTYDLTTGETTALVAYDNAFALWFPE